MSDQPALARMPLELKGGGSSTPAWGTELRVIEDWTARTAGVGQMSSGYNKLLETTRNRLLHEFDSPQFREKYRSLSR